MSIRTPAELVERFRQSAERCDKAIFNDISDIGRERLKRTAKLYRVLADEVAKIQEHPVLGRKPSHPPHLRLVR
jgi:plasmid stabilization system protein ParE